MTWGKECWIMHGKATTVHCLHMDKQAVASHTLSWAVMLTEVNYVCCCLIFKKIYKEVINSVFCLTLSSAGNYC